MDISELQKILQSQKAAPVHLWEPDYCGEMDMVIKADGTWFYMGTPIGRPPLVKLFSTVLRLDDDGEYYLVTPVEKIRITVEDAPFVAIEVDALEEGGESRLVFRTNVDELVVAGPDHRIRVETDASDQTPRPYLHVRSGLEALIGRNVFYQLVDMAEQTNNSAGALEMVVSSLGERFVLGSI